MSKLPPISIVELDHEVKSLWPLILRAEDDALPEAAKAGAPKAGTQKIYQKYTDNLIGARVVGSLQDLWKHQVSRERPFVVFFTVPGVGVGTEAEAQAHYTAIYNLGLFYQNHLMRTLIRDGHRCVLTGAYDSDSCDKYPDLDARATAEQANVTNTQCAHIFSESAQDDDKVTEYAASAMVILKIFGLTDKAENLVGGNPNTYDVCAAKPSFFTRTVELPHRRVTFKVDPDVEAACRANNKPVPTLPSPTLLAIRAACSSVAHMAGTAEQIDQVLCDLEDTRIMAEDGSTVDLLTSRLLQSPRGVRITA
ncbi:hypothetical protein B0H14DRAFT_2964326 [Mycena olivaceomarginata]|nr:hypothetical protein B0H14DRAFT_2964326 [Mycena olivaceomarginata]